MQQAVQILAVAEVESAGAQLAESMRVNLAGAAVHFEQWETKLAWSRFFSVMPIVLGATLAIIALEISVAHLTGTASTLVLWTTGGAVAAGSLVMALAMRQRRLIDWRELAERLDLAVGDQNAIATALDLIRCGDRSPISALAIADGIKSAAKFGMERPVVAVPIVSRRRNAYWVGAGLIAVALACCIPMQRPGGLHPASAQLVSIPAKTDITGNNQMLLPPNPPTASPLTVTTTANSSNPANAAQQPAARSDNLSTQPGIASSSALSGMGGKSAKGSPSAPSPSAPSPHSDSHSTDPVSSDAGNKHVSVASLGSVSNDASSSLGSPTGGTGGESADSKSQSSSSAERNSNSGAPGRNAPADQSNSPANSGTGQGVSPTHAMSQGGKKSDSSSNDATGGNGQGSGQSPPKKSRSVAPLMLGSIQPDLLQGVQLPGPDERIKLQVPPQPGSESPGNPDAAAQTRSSESKVDIYVVPPESQRSVDQYFFKFHQDVIPPATGSN